MNVHDDTTMVAIFFIPCITYASAFAENISFHPSVIISITTDLRDSDIDTSPHCVSPLVQVLVEVDSVVLIHIVIIN